MSAPTVNSEITDRGQISGNFTAQSANDLAVLLRAGALPAAADDFAFGALAPEDPWGPMAYDLIDAAQVDGRP